MRSRFGPGVALGIVAVVLACTGSAVAGSMITGAKIKNGTVTGKDIRNHTLASGDLKRSAVTRKTLNRSVRTDLADPTTVQTADVSMPAGQSTQVQVRCPPGQTVTGGGGEIAGKSGYGEITASKPFLQGASDIAGWEVWVARSPGSVDPQPSVPDVARGWVVCQG